VVEFEGKSYDRDSRGKYRCPNPCSDPNYPPRSWVSDAGFLKHLAECRGKPERELVWNPSAAQEREKFADCPDCHQPIWKMTSYWEMTSGKFVCIDCYLPYYERGEGFHAPAGLDISQLALEV